MGFFSKKKTAKKNAENSTVVDDSIKIIEKPQICCIDLADHDYLFLQKNGHNLFEGTLGAIVKVDTKKHDIVPVMPDYNFPINLHEFDVLVVDLTNEREKEYNPSEYLNLETRQHSYTMLGCRYPATIFDPRPISASVLRQRIADDVGKVFVQIIFSTKDYSVKYNILNREFSIQVLGSEEHSIYNLCPSVPLGKIKFGKEVTVLKFRSDLSTLLERHKKSIKYHQTFNHPQFWDGKSYIPDPNFLPLIANINGEIVSFFREQKDLFTFVFPDLDNKGAFLAELLSNIFPSIFPDLFPFSTQFKWKSDPTYFLPGHSILLDEKAHIEEEYNKAIDAINQRIKVNNDQHSFLLELITETGERLVQTVCTFLRWLDFKSVVIKDENAANILEEDLQVEIDNGLLVIETKGIGGTSTDSDCSQISKIKHRRCKERNAFDVFALYIVNHQRYLPPLKRMNPPFTEHQISDASNDERGLLSTWQLFNLYTDIQNGIITKQEAREAMLEFGLIEFKPKMSVSLPSIKELLKGGSVVVLDIYNTKIAVGQVLIVEKGGKFIKAKILSIHVNDKSVNEMATGEVGLLFDIKIPNGASLWIQ